MDVNLHDLSRIVSSSNGYLSVNSQTGDLQTKGSNFLSRLVIWIRFKTSSSYRSSIIDAKRKVMASMLSDQTYGDNFRLRIEGLDKKNGFFFNSKPLSARKIRRFIVDVTQDVDQAPKPSMSAEELRTGLVAWVCGAGGTIASRETFADSLSAMLAEKIKDTPSIVASDVNLKGIGDEIHQAALADQEGMATITDSTQAKAHVSKVMSHTLDLRIATLRSQRQEELRKRLSVSGLSEANQQAVNLEISSSRITTMDDLDQHINQLVIKQIDDEFTQLLQQTQEKHSTIAHFACAPEVRKQLITELSMPTEHRMLSVAAARDKATQLLTQWLQSKQEALPACQESRYPGINNLLTKLCLEEASFDKTHVQSFRQTIEQTLDEVYAQNRSAYEALSVDKAKLFAMLSHFDKRAVLFRRLQSAVRETSAHQSIFSNDIRQPPKIGSATRKYIESLSKPMAESYAQVTTLKGKVPLSIYRTMIEKVAKGYVWEPRFISAANGLHINSLIQQDNKGFYELLDSPQVARKKIGSKDDFVSFSLDDLLYSMLGSKDIDNHKKRRQAIDQVIPKEVKIRLLNELDQQLQRVQSRVMNEADADALFQRGAVRFLRTQKIDFEALSLNE